MFCFRASICKNRANDLKSSYEKRGGTPLGKRLIIYMNQKGRYYAVNIDIIIYNAVFSTLTNMYQQKMKSNVFVNQCLQFDAFITFLHIAMLAMIAMMISGIQRIFIY